MQTSRRTFLKLLGAAALMPTGAMLAARVKDEPAYEIGADISNGNDSTAFVMVDGHGQIVKLMRERHEAAIMSFWDSADRAADERMFEPPPEWYTEESPYDDLPPLVNGTRSFVWNYEPPPLRTMADVLHDFKRHGFTK